ncbi:helix-turn-helix domain-containing protein [Chitinophaga japonensis]|uniref:Helix-turn-helix protein n=1 Tax=Chitinophaga japonensis TaxID=104662 RepID=A0A562SMG4_CHIJA|nr:helix-turn-helix domain-containing protein [Chitinophaga japonensis]TWI82501.1 helix-turn-helix protein [Chitinophaga japonensis]
MFSPWTITKRLPARPLRPFIMEYSFRNVKVPAGHTHIQHMPVWCQSTLDFFLGERITTINCASALEVPFARSVIRGLRTHQKHYIRVQGDFTVFVVKLTPGGLHGLLGIPAHLFCDEVVDGTLVHRALFAEITEQLLPCTDIDSCVAIAEPYLLKLAQKNAYSMHAYGAVDLMTRLINTGKVPGPIAQLQQKVCLSQRQLERNFMKEVGTSPKHYSRMVRFTNMLYYKMRHKGITWPALAYEFGYTDQMHLTRDFRYFLGDSPGRFRAENYACFEETPPKFL